MMTANTRLLRLAWVMVFVLVTGGCAATSKNVTLTPQPLDMEAKRFSPPPEKANIYITETSGLAKGMLFQVYLDGKLAGSIAPEIYLLFEVEPGNHQIAVLTKDSQETITITARSGDNSFVDVVPKLGWQFGWTIGRPALAELTPEEGRKAVQNAKRAETSSSRP